MGVGHPISSGRFPLIFAQRQRTSLTPEGARCGDLLRLVLQRMSGERIFDDWGRFKEKVRDPKHDCK